MSYADEVQAMGDKVFIEWEEAKGTFLGGKLVRPDKYCKAHYTGKVLSVGRLVDDIQVGDRVFFDQFCGPEEIQEEGKRYAFIRESDALALVPERVEV